MNMLSEKVREITALVLFGLALFAFLATASHTDFTEPGGSSPANLCGHTGHVTSEYMLHTFGYASYALYVCVAVWGIILFLRKDVENLMAKGVGLLAFTLFASALLSHFLAGTPSGIPDHGGLVGLYLNDLFTYRLGLGTIGARITLVLLAMITFLLATDWLYYSSLAAFAKWTVRKQAHWREARETRKEQRAAAARAGLALRPGGSYADKDEEEPESAEEQEIEEKKDKKAVRALMQKMQESGRIEEEEPEEENGSEEYEEEEPGETENLGTARKGKQKTRKSKKGLRATHTAGDPIRYSPPPVQKWKDYKFPPLDLLEKPEGISQVDLQRSISKTSDKLETRLRSFKIDAEVVEIQKGPVITMFELELAPGIKVERIRALDDDIAMAVKAQNVRIVAPIPGKSTFGIEVPNALREVVRLKELLISKDFKDSHYALPICLGKDAAGRHLVEDLAKMPHLLVAGATGSGKSVCLNSIIMSILYTRTPDQTKMILIDPKMVELSSFKSIPHLMCPVVTDMKRANSILEWAVAQMDARYEMLSRAGVRNIYAYNKLGEDELRKRLGDLIDEEDLSPIMPFIVIIVDELADLMMIGTKEIEGFITRLAQKSRAVGIHLILATQRPSTNVITGLIKANMPTRIAFKVASKIDSRVILDINGADKLLGQGDMLYIPPRTSALARAQGTFISDDEIRNVVNFLKDKCGPVFEEDLMDKKPDASFDPFAVDDLYEEATGFIIETQRGSASLLQRRFSIGYTRASRLIDLMAQDAILGTYKGSQAREVLVTTEEWEERLQAKNA